ncbi:hypothetical protein [Nonomuraea sp. NPDC049758]|uniref:hypothetical protein n=1 Tax=Nonomuraea sp. NPDC049758 TaxID=3154360 RepID=UPI00341400DC
MSRNPRDLGMDVPISRRDLFDGIAVSALGCSAAKAVVNAAEPAGGLRGDTAQAVAVPHALRDGRFWRHAGQPEPTGESYDLVVVGGGRSGNSAAAEWLRREPRARVLVLDNRDPGEHGGPAGFGAGPAVHVMCDRESFGADTLVPAGRLEELPLVARAVDNLRMLRDDPPDWFPGLSQEDKQERLAGLTYSRFLLEVCGAHPDAERFCRTLPCAERAFDGRALGAVDAWAAGYPGFGGLGLDKPSRYASAAGPATGSPPGAARAVLRPSSPVVSVRHGDASVVVAYFDGHRVRTVGAESVIMACWSAVVPHLVPDLPEQQRRALGQAARLPVLEASVRLRGGRARIGRTRWTGAFWCLSEPAPEGLRLLATPCRSELGPVAGAAAGRREMMATPYDRLADRVRDQVARLLGPRAGVEAVTVHRWGHGLPVAYCRPWHPFYPDGPFPADVARRRFGRIAIAGSDTEPAAGGDAAVVAAHRAVRELTA